MVNLKRCYSDGGGRSGVYLAVDANMELAEEEDTFDVFGYLKKLRQSRRGLIESLVRNEKSFPAPKRQHYFYPKLHIHIN